MSGAIALVQARLGSTRLPGKVLMDIGGQSMLQRVLNRVEAAPGIDRVCLCVTSRDYAGIAGSTKSWPWRPTVSWAGAPDDVLGRLAYAVESLRLRLDSVLVRITADCPLIDPWLIKVALDAYGTSGPLLSTSCSDKSGWPDGQDVEVFDVAMLANAAAAATDPYDGEHVTPWMRRHMGGVQTLAPEDPHTFDGLPMKWSVDTQNELDFVRRIYGALGEGMWGIPAVVDYLRRTGDKP